MEDTIVFGYALPRIEGSALATTTSSYSSDTSFERLSSSEYGYSITFAYDISTSENPNIAGHASDVIVGGGIDIIVTEGFEGK